MKIIQVGKIVRVTSRPLDLFGHVERLVTFQLHRGTSIDLAIPIEEWKQFLREAMDAPDSGLFDFDYKITIESISAPDANKLVSQN